MLLSCKLSENTCLSCCRVSNHHRLSHGTAGNHLEPGYQLPLSAKRALVANLFRVAFLDRFRNCHGVVAMCTVHHYSPVIWAGSSPVPQGVLIPVQGAAGLVLGDTGFEEILLFAHICLFVEPRQSVLCTRKGFIDLQ